jgi:hypothetical protein
MLMPEISLGFPRSFVEFTNPDDADEVFRCDLTWLTSRWTCIFGRGCPGIYESSPHAGCCTLGAHFSDNDDAQRTKAVMHRLTPDLWQNHDEGRARGWAERDDDGDLKTRAFNGACIFHNQPDFAGGYGCALHIYAESKGLEPHTVKPDVCWQLPLRRQFRDVDRGDGTTYTETLIGEYTRAGWGPGGADLDWYCSSNTDAHVADEPVYITNRAELTAMMGHRAYAELEKHCRAHEIRGANTPHPADPIR